MSFDANPLAWIDAFLESLVDVLDPPAWPSREGEHYAQFAAAWADAFRRNRIGRDEAEKAMRGLVASPPRLRRDYLPAILRAVEAQRPRREPVADDRDAAKLASRDCPRCDGEGITGVFHPDPCYAARRPERVPAYCVCPLGRWIKGNHRINKECAETYQRMVDLSDVLSGRSTWQADPPDWPDEATRRQAIHGDPATFHDGQRWRLIKPDPHSQTQETS